jgi:hypothetical protein
MHIYRKTSAYSTEYCLLTKAKYLRLISYTMYSCAKYVRLIALCTVCAKYVRIITLCTVCAGYRKQNYKYTYYISFLRTERRRKSRELPRSAVTQFYRRKEKLSLRQRRVALLEKVSIKGIDQ